MKDLAIARIIALLTLTSLLPCHSVSAWGQQPAASPATANGGAIDAATANDPTASITQLQIQSWYNPSYIDERGQGNNLLIQPVVSYDSVGFVPSSIVRLTIPVDSQPNGRTGLGDLAFVDLFFPGYHHQKIKAGFGPVLGGPSATNRYAGAGQWTVGPAVVVVYTGIKGLILGGLVTNPISVAGERSRPSVNDMTFEPLVTKILPKSYFIRFDPYWSFNWQQHGSATIPILLGLGRLVNFHGQAMNLYVEPEVLARRPPYPGNNPSHVTIKFNISLIAPPKKKD